MSYFAQVKNSVVQQVIAAEQDFINTLPDAQDWIQTSYRTRGNQHPEGRSFRGNFAGIGDIYDHDNDVFYNPKPWPSWQLNTTTWTWSAPIARPTDGAMYAWDENTQTWIKH